MSDEVKKNPDRLTRTRDIGSFCSVCLSKVPAHLGGCCFEKTKQKHKFTKEELALRKQGALEFKRKL